MKGAMFPAKASHLLMAGRTSVFVHENSVNDEDDTVDNSEPPFNETQRSDRPARGPVREVVDDVETG